MNKKFKVLFPYNRDRVGGSYISSSQLAKYLQEETEFAPLVALPRNAANRHLFEKYGLEIVEHAIRIASNTYGSSRWSGRAGIFHRWWNVLRAWRFLGQIETDAVHIHDDNSLYTWGRAAKWRGIPTVWHVRLEHRKPLDRLFVKLSDHIICISKGCLWRFEENQQLKSAIDVIYNGIVLDEFALSSEDARAQIRQELGLPVDALICGFVGNLVDRKRPEWAYTAVEALNADGMDAHFVCVGQDRGAPSYTERFNQDSEENLLMRGKVHMLGLRHDLNSIMGAFDVLMVPSEPHGEPFSRVVAEACASGVPVVASAGVGALELLDRETDCIRVDDDSCESFCDGVVGFCRDYERMWAVANAGKSKATEVFSYRRMGQQTAEFYRSKLL